MIKYYYGHFSDEEMKQVDQDPPRHLQASERTALDSCPGSPNVALFTEQLSNMWLTEPTRSSL